MTLTASEQGQTVASSFQTPELFIIAPEMEKHMHVFASVDEADIGQILSAQRRNPKLQFLRSVNPIGVLQSISSDAQVCVQGIGLTAYDIVSEGLRAAPGCAPRASSSPVAAYG